MKLTRGRKIAAGGLCFVCLGWMAQPVLGAETIIPLNDFWRYRDWGVDLGTAWRAAAFDDSDWVTGQAELGYGDGGEVTMINGGLPTERFITTYFRRAFSVGNPADYSTLTLRLLRDDGAVVYLNGAEVFRSNMPAGEISYEILAVATVAGAAETQLVQTTLNPLALQPGQNVLAVEVHQATVDSSDLSFDLELTGETNSVITLPSTLVQVDEDSAVAMVQVARWGGLASTATVRYETTNGTALAGLDYIPVSGTLVFDNGESLHSIAIPILDDTTPESLIESFGLLLSNPSGAPLVNALATINIFEDDGYVEWVRTNLVLAEVHGGVLMEARRLGNPNRPVSVRVRALDGSATGNVDYVVENDLTLAFSAGQTNLPVFINVTDDSLVEGEEVFAIELFEPTGGAILNSRAWASVTILDNDTAGGPGRGFSPHVETLAVQSDGNVIAGGFFSQVDGQWRACVARLNTDGSVDPGFVPAPGAFWGVRSVAVRADGRVWIGGEFTEVDGVPRGRVARLEANGQLDSAFDPGTGANDLVFEVLATQSDKVLLVGAFTAMNGNPRRAVARLTASGQVDDTFDAGLGPTPPPGVAASLVAIAEQADGKLIVSGNFTQFNGAARGYLARLHPDGALDTTFNPVINGAPEVIQIQPDGKILIGGWFNTVNGLFRNRMARLHPDGTTDSSFNAGLGPSDTPIQMALQPDGKILVAGVFSNWSASYHGGLVRLNPNGTLDNSFRIGPGSTGWVLDVDVLPDDRIVAAGTFTLFNGRDRFRVVYLNPDGSEAPEPVRWVPWPANQGGNDHWYALTPEPGSWTNAQQTANQYLGHLASVTSPAEQSFLESTFLTNLLRLRPLWIGLSDAASQGTFQWSSGEPMSFAHWIGSEPDGGMTQNHVALNWVYSRDQGEPGAAAFGRWSDIPAQGTTFTGQADGPYYGIMELAVAPFLATALTNLVWIAPGTFPRGDAMGEADEQPVQWVDITGGFWMSRHEVTQWDYLSLMGTNPGVFVGDLARPVENVSWDDAVQYCARLSDQERLEGRLPPGYEYRLPTEAQWEHAARAGTTTYYSFGDRDQWPLLDQYAWYDLNSGGATHKVGQKLANPWGLYDVHGNVWEWVSDWFEPYSSTTALVDPAGPATGVWRVFKGGGFNGTADQCHTADRNWDEPGYRSSLLGFRVALVRTDLEPLVWIPPGSFVMGSPMDELGRSSHEGPQTQVTLTRGFWMGRFEVTQTQFQSIMGFNPSQFDLGPNYPVEQVTWDQAREYCARLTQVELAAGRVPFGYAYRLPVEAEWEYACRAGTSTPFSFGGQMGDLDFYARYYLNSGCSLLSNDCSLGTPAPVGSKFPNPWGLQDMHGNVAEFVLDWYGPYPGGSVTDPAGPMTGTTNVFRGPAWDFGDVHNRSASRWPYPRGASDNSIGFRVVLAPAEAPAILERGSVWKYFDSGADLETAWRELDFDDSAWPAGPARLGYGGDGEVTALGFGPDPNNKYRTYYFRKEVTVGEPSAFSTLIVRLLRDDGAILYVNGMEALRSNMPSGTVNAQTFAAGTVANANEQTYFSSNLSPSLFRPGLNVLAVEVHQIAADSSDVSFDLELVGQRASGPPILFEQPQDRDVAAGSDITYRVVAAGSPPLGFQWFANGSTPIPGATQTSLTLPNVQPSDAADFHVVVTNPQGAATSVSASLQVGYPPIILGQPASTNIAEFQSATFCVEASGTPALHYRWLRNGVPFVLDGDPCLTVTNLRVIHSSTFTVQITNVYGAVTSQLASLNVLLPVGLVGQPVSTNVALGQDAMFCVTPSGTGPFSYQWRKNGVNIPQATNTCLTLTNVQVSDGAKYSVAVANRVGAITSDPATLTVLLPILQPGDTFDNRVPITGHSGLIAGDTTLATLDPGEPLHAGRHGGRSVWYTWTAPASGIARFRTAGSAFDTLLAVYQGGSLDQLIEIVSDDDNAGFYTSDASFQAGSNVTYQVAIDGLAGAAGLFALDWNLEVTADELPVILTQPASQTVPLGATLSFQVEVSTANAQYQWEFQGIPLLNETGPVLTLTEAQPSQVGMYRVRVTGANERQVASLPALLEIGPQPNARSADKFEDLLDASIPLEGFGPKPAGGRAPSITAASGSAGVQPLLVGSGSIDGSQFFSSANSLFQESEPNHCGEITGASRWLFIQATNAGYLRLDTIGALDPECSDFDTVLVVYTNQGSLFLGNIQVAACDNNSAPDGKRSVVVLPVKPNLLYMVAMDGVNGASGCFQLNWEFGFQPQLSISPIQQLAQTGTNLVLTAPGISGAPAPSLQWLWNGQPLPRETNDTLTLYHLRPDQAGLYQIVARNFAGSATNLVAIVGVTGPISLGFIREATAEGYRFRINGTISQSVTLDYTTNFLEWIPIYTNSAPNQPIDFIDLESPFVPMRFYRASPWP